MGVEGFFEGTPTVELLVHESGFDSELTTQTRALHDWSL